MNTSTTSELLEYSFLFFFRAHIVDLLDGKVEQPIGLAD